VHSHHLGPCDADMAAATLSTDESAAAAEQPSPAANGSAAANGADGAASEANAEAAKRLRNLQKKLRQVRGCFSCGRLSASCAANAMWTGISCNSGDRRLLYLSLPRPECTMS